MTELTVRDAIVALRSFPRRYREAFDGLDDEVLRARNGGRSVLDNGSEAAAVLERFDAALGPVLDARHPVLGDLDVEPVTPPVTEPDSVLRRITAAATGMANRAEAAPSEAWERTFTSGRTERPARWIVQQAVEAVAFRLRAIERLRAALNP